MIERQWFEIVICKNLPPASPIEGKHGKESPWTLNPGDSLKIGWPTNGPHTIETADYMGLGNHRDFIRQNRQRPKDCLDLFVIGWINYRFETKQLRRAGFCQRYNFLTERFERIADPDYEYGDQS
jgi:hypothetical protein